MAKITIPDIASQFASQEALNARFTQVENELNNKVLYRDSPDGEPNAMAQELDMNTNRIINLPEPVNPNDAARLQDVQAFILDAETAISTQTEAVTLTAGQVAVVFSTLLTTGASFNISGADVDDARLVLGRDFSIINSTNILLTQSYPAGTLLQLLRNAVGGDDVVGVTYSQSETKTLIDSQTTVAFGLSTQYAGFYISGNDTDSGRLSLSDYTLISNTTIELAQSYPEGTTVTLLRNSSEGSGVEPGGQVDSIVAGTNVTVDNSDPANPVISSSGGGGGGGGGLALTDAGSSDAYLVIEDYWGSNSIMSSYGDPTFFINKDYTNTDAYRPLASYLTASIASGTSLIHPVSGNDSAGVGDKVLTTHATGVNVSEELRIGGFVHVKYLSGTGSPQGVKTAPVGSMYTRTDGGVGSTLYVKESGTGNTGWAAK